MQRIFIAAALAGFVAAPAFAQADQEGDAMAAEEMTCEEFMAMDEAGQMEAMTQMEMAMAESEGSEMSEEDAMASGEEMMPGTVSGCEGNPDMMAMDAMQEGMSQ